MKKFKALQGRPDLDSLAAAQVGFDGDNINRGPIFVQKVVDYQHKNFPEFLPAAHALPYGGLDLTGVSLDNLPRRSQDPLDDFDHFDEPLPSTTGPRKKNRRTDESGSLPPPSDLGTSVSQSDLGRRKQRPPPNLPAGVGFPAAPPAARPNLPPTGFIPPGEAVHQYNDLKDSIEAMLDLGPPFASDQVKEQALAQRERDLELMENQLTDIQVRTTSFDTATEEAKKGAEEALADKVANLKSLMPKRKYGPYGKKKGATQQTPTGIGQGGATPIPTYPRPPGTHRSLAPASGQSSMSGAGGYSSGPQDPYPPPPNYGSGPGYPGAPPGSGNGLKKKPSQGDLKKHGRGRQSKRFNTDDSSKGSDRGSSAGSITSSNEGVRVPSRSHSQEAKIPGSQKSGHNSRSRTPDSMDPRSQKGGKKTTGELEDISTSKSKKKDGKHKTLTEMIDDMQL